MGHASAARRGHHRGGRGRHVDRSRDLKRRCFPFPGRASRIAASQPAGHGTGAFGALAQHLHASFPDPAEAAGSDEERMAVFRAVRDDIRARLIAELERRENRPSTPGPSR